MKFRHISIMCIGVYRKPCTRRQWSVDISSDFYEYITALIQMNYKELKQLSLLYTKVTSLVGKKIFQHASVYCHEWIFLLPKYPRLLNNLFHPARFTLGLCTSYRHLSLTINTNFCLIFQTWLCLLWLPWEYYQRFAWWEWLTCLARIQARPPPTLLFQKASDE